MTDKHVIGTVADAAATLANPELGNGAAKEAEVLTGQILANPHLGAKYIAHLAQERDIPLGSLTADDIHAALIERVAGEPVLKAYVLQLYDLAKQAPVVQANPDRLLPENSLERLAMETPSPHINRAQTHESLLSQPRGTAL